MPDSPRMNIADLDRARLAKLQQAEKELGVCLVALQPQYELAHLTDDQLRTVQQLEEDLGVLVLAYRKP